MATGGTRAQTHLGLFCISVCCFNLEEQCPLQDTGGSVEQCKGTNEELGYCSSKYKRTVNIIKAAPPVKQHHQ